MAKRSRKTPSRQTPAAVPASDTFWTVILFLLVVVAYSPAWWSGFVWDDVSLITNNPVIVGPLGLKEIWTTAAADICPLTLTTFWLEHKLWGLAPLPFHLVNVLLHAACATALWRVLRCLNIPGAWLGAALWALHPVMVQSVAWIAETKNTESGLFFLLSALFFVKNLRPARDEPQKNRNRNYALTLLFAALAMAGKSSTVILPVVLCLCAWWMERRWHWRSLLRLIPLFLMALAAGALSIWTQGLPLADDSYHPGARSWPERLATAGDAVWFYLGKLCWPHPLVMIYPRWTIDPVLPISYLPLLAALLLLFVFWLKRKSWGRPWFLAWTFYLVALLPALGLIDNPIFRYSFVFDHLQYLAAMGPLALAGAGIFRLADLAAPQKPWLPTTIGAGLLLILGTATWLQTSTYQGETALWTDTIAVNPDSFRCRIFLGNALAQDGQTEAAIRQYQTALDINPKSVEAYNNLGSVLLHAGQVDAAIDAFQTGLKIDPKFDESYVDLGNALSQKGEVDAAIKQYLKVLKIDPNFAQAHVNLGAALMQKGQIDAAIEQYQAALTINPNLAEAAYDLGVAFLKKGQVDAAIGQYRSALEINPNYAKACENLGVALFQKGQVDEAIGYLERALRLEPGNATYQSNFLSAKSVAAQAAGSK